MRETLREELIPKLKEATAQEVESGQRFKTFLATVHGKTYILHWQMSGIFLYSLSLFFSFLEAHSQFF